MSLSQPANAASRKGPRMRKLLVGLLLLMAAVGPACAVSSYDGKDLARALATYRTEFPKIWGSETPMSSYNADYDLFSRVLDRALADHVAQQDPNVLVDRALTGARKKKAEKPEASQRELNEAALHAMLHSLDPYSEFLDVEQYRYLREQTQGEFGGLGIEVSADEESGLVRVVAPIDGSPAAAAGLRPGDLVARIDDAPVKGMKLSEAVARMRGRIGTSVMLTIQRTAAAPFKVKLTRSIVQIKSVRHHLESGDVGYVRIATFNQQTTPGLDDAIKDLQHTSPSNKLAGLILDLRNNLGGLLDQAVGVSDRFLDEKDIVTVRGRKAADNRLYSSDGNQVLADLPMVLLVNSGSASASEIVAGALQDHGRALLMGVRTYGKGSVQTLSPLNDEVGMRLTTARYFRPSGSLVDCFGVTPDVEISAANGNAKEMHADPAACDPTAPPPPAIRPSRMEDICPETSRTPPAKDADVSVQCAVEYIHNRSFQTAIQAKTKAAP